MNLFYTVPKWQHVIIAVSLETIFIVDLQGTVQVRCQWSVPVQEVVCPFCSVADAEGVEARVQVGAFATSDIHARN